MAKHSSQMMDLARRGAEARIKELHAEILAITRHFPDLGWRGGTKRKSNAAESAPPKRRKMSAAARAKISAAQKKRWAKQKAAGS